MPRYHRILAVVELGRSGREVARRAWEMAAGPDVRLAIGHVADWGLDLGADDFCPYTPQELEARLERVIARKLRTLASQIGAAEAATLVSFAGASRGIGALARRWQPDLVVVGGDADHGLGEATELSVPGWRCEARVVPVTASGLWTRTVRQVVDALRPGRLAPR
ncbi:MAG: universal stress protein [Magnetospirillum sp.]|nr:universal stress protein [Magnetospirillum sp.]